MTDLTGRPQITFTTRRVRVPSTGVVRLPGRYAHDFASIPLYWKEIAGVTSKFMDYPTLDPSMARRLIREIFDAD